MSDIYNRIELEDGRVLIDITDATATANDVRSGSKFHDATGSLEDGTGDFNDEADEVFVTGAVYDSVTAKRFVASVDSTKTSDGDIISSTTKIVTPKTIVDGTDTKNISASGILKGKTCYTSVNGTPLVGTGEPRIESTQTVSNIITLTDSNPTVTYTFTDTNIARMKGSKYCVISCGEGMGAGIVDMITGHQAGGCNRIFIKNDGKIPVGTYNMSFYSYQNSIYSAQNTSLINLSIQITETQMIITRTGTLLNQTGKVGVVANTLNIGTRV